MFSEALGDQWVEYTLLGKLLDGKLLGNHDVKHETVEIARRYLKARRIMSSCCVTATPMNRLEPR